MNIEIGFMKEEFSWAQLHLDLQELLKKELEVLRDFLSNLSEEEEALFCQNTQNQKLIAEKRPSFTKSLRSIRQKKSRYTKELFSFSGEENYESWRDVVKQDQENAEETLLLDEQINLLKVKIRKQKLRNQQLAAAPQRMTLQKEQAVQKPHLKTIEKE